MSSKTKVTPQKYPIPGLKKMIGGYNPTTILVSRAECRTTHACLVAFAALQIHLRSSLESGYYEHFISCLIYPLILYPMPSLCPLSYSY